MGLIKFNFFFFFVNSLYICKKFFKYLEFKFTIMNDPILKSYLQRIRQVLVLLGYMLIVSVVLQTLYFFILIFH